MAAGGFSRIYAGIGGDQIDLYFNKQVLKFLFQARTDLYFIKKVFKIEIFAIQVQLQWARLRTLLFSFAPTTQSRSKQLESESFLSFLLHIRHNQKASKQKVRVFYLFFCTFDTTRSKQLESESFLSFLLHIRHNQEASNQKVRIFIFSSAPSTQSSNKQLESESFYLFFCTFNKINRQAIRK